MTTSDPSLAGLPDVWGGGHLLAFSGVDGPTDYSQGLVARTGFSGLSMDVKLPGSAHLTFSEEAPSRTRLAGDFFVVDCLGTEIKGAFLDTYHLLIVGPCEVTGVDGPVRIVQGEGRTLIASEAHVDPGKINSDIDDAIAQRCAWLESMSLPAGVSASARRALGKAFSQMKTQVYSPEGRIGHRWTTPDRWPHRDMWLWDTVFHSAGWRHLDVGLAREMMLAMLDVQKEDGFIPIQSNPEKGSVLTQPPVLALGVKLLDEKAGDRSFLKEVYPKLAGYVRWDLENRDSDGAGLVEWAIETNVNCRSGESGMDQLDATDFNAFLAHECEILSHFARKLGKTSEARQWDQAHERLCRLINKRLWHEDLGFYLDYDVEIDAPSPVLASSGFLPLICGAASEEQAARLAGHLADPAMFGTPFGVPSIAARDTEYYTKDMWRGPVWMNINWLIARGFDRCGLKDVAAEIRIRSCAEIEKFCDKYGTFFEFYDDRQELDPPQLNRKGRCAPEVSPYHQAFFDYGWTATLYVDWMFEK